MFPFEKDTEELEEEEEIEYYPKEYDIDFSSGKLNGKIAEGNMCSKCSFAVKCQSKNCIMNSLAYSGTVGEHNPDMCYFERKKRNLWEIYAPQL